jgi:hypothetical protein
MEQLTSRTWKWFGAVAYMLLGFVAWALLIWLPGRGGSNVSPGPYFAVSALLAGTLALLTPRAAAEYRFGALIVLPALATSIWASPKGDGDGLWVLWIPLLAIWLFIVHGIYLSVWRFRLRRTRPQL